MVALGLFQQLCSLARLATVHMEQEASSSSQKQSGTFSVSEGEISCTSHLWKIALKARNTDVSAAAMQYLNTYYMARRLNFFIKILFF